MKKLLAALLSILFAFSIVVATQNSNSSTARTDANAAAPRKMIFRATTDQIKQAQAIMKQRGFYSGAETGALDPNTRTGLKRYQAAEGLKATGTLNKVTLGKMAIALTDKQRAM